MIQRKILLFILSLLFLISCATLDGVNLTGIDDGSLSNKTSLVLVSIVNMKETSRQGMYKIDGKLIEPAGRYYLMPGKHKVTVKYRKSDTGQWLYGNTTINLHGGSSYTFSAFSSGFGLMTMMREDTWYIKGRLDKIRYGMSKEDVKKIMRVDPQFRMTVGKKDSPTRSESWTYSNKKEYGTISFNNNGTVTKTYWGWKKENK